MIKEFLIRVGTFFIVVGVGILILFIASDYAHETDFDYLFWSVIIIAIGMLLRRRKPPPPSSGRFSAYHKWREGSRKHREEKR